MRLWGRPAATNAAAQISGTLTPTQKSVAGAATTLAVTVPLVSTIPALPLTSDAFAAYGSVIQSYSDLRSVRKDVVVRRVNLDTANKFNHLAPVIFLETEAQAKWGGEIKGAVNFCVFRCDPQPGAGGTSQEEVWEVRALERHEFSSQAFVPMGEGGDRYLVVVALHDPGESLLLTRQSSSTFSSIHCV